LFYSVVTVCHPEPWTPLPHYPVFFTISGFFFQKSRKVFGGSPPTKVDI
jgi:hypothetical protein